MKQKQLQQLVSASYTKNKLDEKKVSTITKILSRKQLKSYIRGLKLAEKKKRVIVALPRASLYNAGKKIFIELFPGKEVSVEEDTLLLLGGKVTAGDMVYDFSLKQALEDFLLDLEDTYDE